VVNDPTFTTEVVSDEVGVQLAEAKVDVNYVNETVRPGHQEVVRLSQLSETPHNQTHASTKVCKKRSSKKGHHNSDRPTPHPIGVPKFRQLELTLKVAGRRRKDVDVGTTRADDLPLISTGSEPQPGLHGVEEQAPVRNPVPGPGVPGSGLNLLVDHDGGSVPDSISNSGGAIVRKEEEAKILIEIQKDVGFTFEAGDDEIQSKLVELDNIDRLKHDGREEERVHP
jgi:hypothetical protein